jgi:uncharacterized integral membrane protein
MFEWVGWVATGVFAASYFCRRADRLRLIQAFAALLWIGYGVMIKAPPVIAANVVVAALALASALRRAPSEPGDASPR